MVQYVKPKIYLISVPIVYTRPLSDFLSNEGMTWVPDITSSGPLACEIAGRLCYMSFGKGRKTNEEFLSHIIEVGHESVLEHANYGFIITGVSRSFTHELVRHRHLSFSQLSQRYVDESSAGFILPKAIADANSTDVLERAVKAAQTAYAVMMSNLELLFASEPNATDRRKKARQAARAVLPNATETKIYVTGNARAWRHFIKLRNTPFADVEIREVAQMILKELNKEAPALFGDLIEADSNISR